MTFPEAGSFAIIILNLNGCDVTADCLRSLRESEYRDFFVIVVDNGSTDGSARRLRSEFPEAEIIETGSNLGFTGGNNVGMRIAMDRGARILMLLNNDTIAEKGFLGALASALHRDPALGAVTPRILFHEPADRIWCAGGDYSLWCGIARHRGLRAHRDDPRYNQPAQATFATGCALCVRREVVERIGTLDDSLFIYNEDTDYSVRILKAGWRIAYIPAALLWHREGWDSRRATGQRRRLHLCTRNILRVHAKHRRWWHCLTFFPWFLVRWVLVSGTRALLRGDRDAAVGILSGIAAYWRGEAGPAAG
jgi:GT2 family glycosyltransferase